MEHQSAKSSQKTHDVTTASADQEVPSQSNSGIAPELAILQLQRIIGNQAVRRMLALQRDTAHLPHTLPTRVNGKYRANAYTVLQLQRVVGNAAVSRQLRQIQRILPQNASFPYSANPTSTSSSTNTASNTSRDGATAYRQARALVDAAPANQLSRLRGEVETAIEQYGNRSGVFFTLQLNGQQIANFLSDDLERLHDATDVGSRRNFDRAVEEERRQRQEQERRERRQRIQQELNQYREHVLNYLRQLDQIAPTSGGTATYTIQHPDQGAISVSTAQVEQLKRAVLPYLRQMRMQVNEYVTTTHELMERSFSLMSGEMNLTDTSIRTRINNPVETGRLAPAMQEVFTNIHMAQSLYERAAATAGAAVRDVSENREAYETTLTVLRAVRDGSAAILGTLLTVATGGGLGAIALGATTSAVLGGAGTALEQSVQTINWREILVGVVVNAVVGTVGNRLNPTATTYLQDLVVRRLTGALTTAAAREVLERQPRATVIRFVETQVVPHITGVVIGRLGAVGGAYASSVALNKTPQEIDAAMLDQVSLANIIIELANAHANVRGPNISGAPQQHNFSSSSGSNTP